MQELLNTAEGAIIERMAKEANVQSFQMLNMIKRCPELKEFYQNLRAKTIEGMAV